jgi:Zn ribbon nucleic-acid-binding protein
MAMLEELNTLLERIPVWRQLVALPERVRALEARLAAMESRLAGSTGALCPKCDAPALKFAGTATDAATAMLGFTIDVLRCDSCGHEERRHRDTMTR